LKSFLVYLLLLLLLAVYAPLAMSSVDATDSKVRASPMSATATIALQNNAAEDTAFDCSDDSTCQAPCASGCVALTNHAGALFSASPRDHSQLVPRPTSPRTAHGAGLLRPPRLFQS